MRWFFNSGLPMANQCDQVSRLLSSIVFLIQTTLPPVLRTVAARRLTAGTVPTAVLIG